jgi:hypothetical protein
MAGSAASREDYPGFGLADTAPYGAVRWRRDGPGTALREAKLREAKASLLVADDGSGGLARL